MGTSGHKHQDVRDSVCMEKIIKLTNWPYQKEQKITKPKKGT